MTKSPILLYVEDDPLSIQIMNLVIEKVLGFSNLIIFKNSENFMQNLHALNIEPDLFMLDIHLKPYTGFDLLEMLRKDKKFKNSKIIALTASVMGEEVTRLKSSGFNGAIAKPLDIAEFPALLKRVLSGESVWFVS